MKFRNYRILIEGSSKNPYEKETLRQEGINEMAILLESDKRQNKTGPNWGIHERPYGRMKNI